MAILIEKLSLSDAEELLQFEVENRAYFETLVPGRGDDYYNPADFLNSLKGLLQEQDEGLSYFHLIKKESGRILGRINLVDIDKSNRACELGYRIGKADIGKGLATEAVGKIMGIACREHGLNRISAKTTNDNIGSQKVLEKNGFILVKTEEGAVNFGGRELDFLHYEWSVE